MLLDSGQEIELGLTVTDEEVVDGAVDDEEEVFVEAEVTNEVEEVKTVLELGIEVEDEDVEVARTSLAPYTPLLTAAPTLLLR